jgi:RimJ/RimL family protein N-acetyltransferase
MEIEIRVAVPEDAQAIHVLHCRSLRALCASHHTEEQIERWIERRTPEGYLEGIEADAMFVAVRDARVVGFGHAEPGHVVAVFVDPDVAGRGVGARVLHEALRRAGRGPVVLESTLNAVRFYARYGFVEVERRKVGRVPLDVVAMRLPEDACTLRTPRLLLRPCAESDRDALHALWTDPDVRRYLWDDEVIPVERAAAEIRASVASFEAEEIGCWVVCPAGSAEPVGFAGLRRIEEGVEILFALLPRFWGRGLATEAARAVLEYGLPRLGRILGRTDTPNRRSVRVLERLGMEFEGERPVQGLPTLHYAISGEVAPRT